MNDINLTDVQFLGGSSGMGREDSAYGFDGDNSGPGDGGPPMDDADDLPF